MCKNGCKIILLRRFCPFDCAVKSAHEAHTGGAVDALVRTDTNKDTSVSVTGKLCQHTLSTNNRMRHSQNDTLILKNTQTTSLKTSSNHEIQMQMYAIVLLTGLGIKNMFDFGQITVVKHSHDSCSNMTADKNDKPVQTHVLL